MKKALLVLTLLLISSSAQAIQSQESANGSASMSMPAKVYDKYGSLVLDIARNSVNANKHSGESIFSEKCFEELFENLIVEISCDEVADARLENGALFEIARAALR